MEYNHISVLMNEVIEGLNIKPDGIYVDGTIGGAGHSLEIVKKLSDKGRLIGIDQDEAALLKSKEVLSKYSDRVTLIRNNYVNIHEILDYLHIDKVDGILLDIGVSSFQLDEGDRGFSYHQDAPLDMRMDHRSSLTAWDVVNNESLNNLTKIIYEYGEERWAKRIAEFIVEERRTKSINTTAELVEVIKKAIPSNARRNGPHPARRTFQAIRIFVNDELEVLKKSVYNMTECLNPGGRLAIISFHSLEDRIVKEAFKDLGSSCHCPPGQLICTCKGEKKLTVITRKPIVAGENELSHNRRSRSAKLRIAEKI